MAKVGIKMQSFSCVLSQQLVSVLFIAAVPTHMENPNFFLVLVYIYLYDYCHEQISRLSRLLSTQLL